MVQNAKRYVKYSFASSPPFLLLRAQACPFLVKPCAVCFVCTTTVRFSADVTKRSKITVQVEVTMQHNKENTQTAATLLGMKRKDICNSYGKEFAQHYCRRLGPMSPTAIELAPSRSAINSKTQMRSVFIGNPPPRE